MGTTTLLTFEEFECLPDEPGKHELLDGELIVMPPPKLRHSEIQHRIYEQLRRVVQERALGNVYMETGFRLGGRHWVQPDVSFVRTEQRTSADPDGYLEGAPALAVEVISDANTAEIVDRKLVTCFEYGSEEVWVVYPKTRRIWVYRRNDPVATEHKTQLHSDLFPGWTLEIPSIF